MRRWSLQGTSFHPEVPPTKLVEMVTATGQCVVDASQKNGRQDLELVRRVEVPPFRFQRCEAIPRCTREVHATHTRSTTASSQRRNKGSARGAGPCPLQTQSRKGKCKVGSVDVFVEGWTARRLCKQAGDDPELGPGRCMHVGSGTEYMQTSKEIHRRREVQKHGNAFLVVPCLRSPV
mmetsp:Transcript_2929/g.18393  ORF Transcript_2929/g.18393 Transcript_2929/m.18393 type:complete len:178 (+) Transcript_2929:181-714(+)